MKMTVFNQKNRPPADFDWDALSRFIYVVAQEDTWHSPEAVREAFNGSFCFCVVVVGGKFIGTARAISDGVSWAFLLDVAVGSEHRRKGIGRMMIRELTTVLSKVQSIVVICPHDVGGFYSACGLKKGRVAAHGASGVNCPPQSNPFISSASKTETYNDGSLLRALMAERHR